MEKIVIKIELWEETAQAFERQNWFEQDGSLSRETQDYLNNLFMCRIGDIEGRFE